LNDDFHMNFKMCTVGTGRDLSLQCTF